MSIQSLICQPVGFARRTLWLTVNSPINMKRLAQDLKMLFRSEGMSVTTTASPNILILQIHARGVRGHYYVVKICQNQNQVLIESGIISAKQQLEWAGVEGGIGAVSDIVLHNKWLTLLSGAFAGVDVASVLGSYEEENKILSQIQQVILSYQSVCPNCGAPVNPSFNFCPNCGYKLKNF